MFFWPHNNPQICLNINFFWLWGKQLMGINFKYIYYINKFILYTFLRSFIFCGKEDSGTCVSQKITAPLGVTLPCTQPLNNRQKWQKISNVHNFEKIFWNYPKSKTTDSICRIEIAKFNLTCMKFGILGFFEPLISN